MGRLRTAGEVKGGDWTADFLVAEARARGYIASPGLIRDWVQLGLLAHPHTPGRGQGLGRSVGRWPGSQADLFFELLYQRQRAGVRRVATLCNLPVFGWLTKGDAAVPLAQARRALRIWEARRYARRSRDSDGTFEETHAGWAIERVAGHKLSSRQMRPLLVPVVDAALTDSADAVWIREGAHDVVGPERADAVAGAVESLVRLEQAGLRIVADPAADWLFLRARQRYLELKANQPSRSTARIAPTAGTREPRSAANLACLELTVLVGEQATDTALESDVTVRP